MKKLKRGQTLQLEDLKTGEIKQVVLVQRVTKSNVIVETSDGKEEVVDLLNFVVTVIPLLDIIFNWIGEKISNLFNRT